MRVPRPAARMTARRPEGSVLTTVATFGDRRDDLAGCWAASSPTNGTGQPRRVSNEAVSAANGDCLDLHQGAFGQGSDLVRRARRFGLVEIPGINLVEGGEVVDVGEETGCLGHVRHGQAGGIEDGDNVLEHPF